MRSAADPRGWPLDATLEPCEDSWGEKGQMQTLSPELVPCRAGGAPVAWTLSTAQPVLKAEFLELQSRLSPSQHWVRVAPGQVPKSCSQFWDR